MYYDVQGVVIYIYNRKEHLHKQKSFSVSIKIPLILKRTESQAQNYRDTIHVVCLPRIRQNRITSTNRFCEKLCIQP